MDTFRMESQAMQLNCKWLEKLNLSSQRELSYGLSYVCHLKAVFGLSVELKKKKKKKTHLQIYQSVTPICNFCLVF